MRRGQREQQRVRAHARGGDPRVLRSCRTLAGHSRVGTASVPIADFALRLVRRRRATTGRRLRPASGLGHHRRHLDGNHLHPRPAVGGGDVVERERVRIGRHGAEHAEQEQRRHRYRRRVAPLFPPAGRKPWLWHRGRGLRGADLERHLAAGDAQMALRRYHQRRLRAALVRAERQPLQRGPELGTHRRRQIHREDSAIDADEPKRDRLGGRPTVGRGPGRQPSRVHGRIGAARRANRERPGFVRPKQAGGEGDVAEPRGHQQRWRRDVQGRAARAYLLGGRERGFERRVGEAARQRWADRRVRPDSKMNAMGDDRLAAWW